MRGIPGLVLLALLGGAEAARAGVFRCVGADGSVRFVGSPHACGRERAETHAPRDRLQRIPAPPANAGDTPEAAGEPSVGQSPSASVDRESVKETGHRAESAEPGAEASLQRARGLAELDTLWLDEAALGPGWEVVRELPSDPGRDPDLVEWGVRAQEARHYTRRGGGRVQVCSVEIWAFRDVARARAAHEGFAYPDWEIRREGALLVMLRGVQLQPGRPPRRGVFSDCRGLGDRIRARARPAPPGR